MKLNCNCGQSYTYDHKQAEQTFFCHWCKQSIVMPLFKTLSVENQNDYRKKLGKDRDKEKHKENQRVAKESARVEKEKSRIEANQIRVKSKTKQLLQKRFVHSNHGDRKEFNNLKMALSIYQILLILVLAIQFIVLLVLCFTGAVAGATVVIVDDAYIMFLVVGVLCFAVCVAFTAFVIWLQYIFAMAFIDFVRVIVAIEKNTRTIPS